ncbi:MAG TPA: hypothetical protein VGM63_09020 [Mucilaginibacter sp.]|jgi:hypothetical protein
MKRKLLSFAFLLLPFFCFAQKSTPLIEEFGKKIKHMVGSFQLNDHVSVITLNLDDQNFELAAVDDKMKLLWRANYKGYALGCGKFKGHILAVASADFTIKNGVIAPYNGLLIDEQSGKLILQKQIFESKSETKEWPRLYFSPDGSDFKLVVRQTTTGKTIFQFTMAESTETKDLTVVRLNEKLEPTVSKPTFSGDAFIEMTANANGDLFVITARKDKTVKISKYENGKTEPGAPLTLQIDLNDLDDLVNFKGVIRPSAENANVLFYAIIAPNKNKDDQLTVSKLDFNNHTTQSVTEVLDRKHIKEIEKAYVPFDKKLDKPDISFRRGQHAGLNVKHVEEYNGTLLVAWSYSGIIPGNMNSYTYQDNALVINGYSPDLKPKLQQVLPILFNGHPMSSAFHAANNSLYVITSTSVPKDFSVFGQLDINSGKWLKLEPLPLDKKHFANKDVCWFKESLVVPMMRPVGLLPPLKEDFDLQLDKY